MIIIHSGNNFSCTNLFQFDYDLKPLDRTKPELGLKKIEVIRNIKKLFNFDSNNYVTFSVGDVVTVILPNRAMECEVVGKDKFSIVKNLEINIKEILKKLKDGRRITG